MKSTGVIMMLALLASFVLARAADWRIWGIFSSVCLAELGMEVGTTQLVILAMAFASHLVVKARMDQALVALMTAANLFLVQTETMLGLIIGIEALSLAGYAILIENNRGQRNSEAALRVAVPGMLATLLMAAGTLLSYEQYGMLEIQRVNFLILFGICIKLAIFPFFYYLVKAFEGAPIGMTIVTTYGKLGILLTLSRWVDEEVVSQESLWWLGTGTVLIGALFLLTAKSMGEWLGALIVGNGGFAVVMVSVPNEYFEWYIVVSQMALIVMLGTQGRQTVVHYLARLSFLGFPSTIIFWIKYGFLFTSSISTIQVWIFLTAGTIMTFAAMVSRHQMAEHTSILNGVTNLPPVAVSAAIVTLCSLVLSFVIV